RRWSPPRWRRCASTSGPIARGGRCSRRSTRTLFVNGQDDRRLAGLLWSTWMPVCSGGDPSIVRNRSFIAVAAVLAVLIGVAAAMGVLDARAKDHIAKGVTVGGVDVGGLTPKEARARLHQALLAPLG